MWAKAPGAPWADAYLNPACRIRPNDGVSVSPVQRKSCGGWVAVRVLPHGDGNKVRLDEVQPLGCSGIPVVRTMMGGLVDICVGNQPGNLA